MFGWLAARSRARCTQATPVAVPWRMQDVAPCCLMRRLARLGNVLYLYDTRATVITHALPPGLLVAQQALAPLLDTRWLWAASVVSDDGPREWCECVDRFGRVRARLHLLPDTDYLAWDALTAGNPVNDTLPTRFNTPMFRPDRASVINFHTRELAGLMLLEQRVPLAVSALGQGVATRIAQAEAVMLC